MPVPNPLIAEIRASFHQVWSKAARGRAYNRREWGELQAKLEQAFAYIPDVLGSEDPTFPGVVKLPPGGRDP